ncbi:MAG: response regulator transcription factor [Eubacteriales bacterium]|nr:response regulator transcription factor [Eubacteriales bacterium]
MRLLLAEDEKSLSRALTKILEASHYSVDSAYNGEEALDFLAVSSYDAVILDLMMPKVDGLTVLRTMRSENNLTPVLILTARSEVDDKVLGLDLGANDYLTKPFDPKELLARIRAITRVQTKNASSLLSFGDVTLSQTNYELSCGENTLRLANKEFQLMELLMDHPNQVLSTEQIFERIWGLDSDAETSIIWVYISYLRRKLKTLGAHVLIKATRNVGYSLVIDESDNQ